MTLPRMLFPSASILGLKSINSFKSLKGFPMTSRLPPLTIWQATLTKTSRLGKAVSLD